jgi:hypothetical protein
MTNQSSLGSLGSWVLSVELFSNQKRTQEEEEERDCFETDGSVDQSFPMT